MKEHDINPEIQEVGSPQNQCRLQGQNQSLALLVHVLQRVFKFINIHMSEMLLLRFCIQDQ